MLTRPEFRHSISDHLRQEAASWRELAIGLPAESGRYNRASARLSAFATYVEQAHDTDDSLSALYGEWETAGEKGRLSCQTVWRPNRSQAVALRIYSRHHTDDDHNTLLANLAGLGLVSGPA